MNIVTKIIALISITILPALSALASGKPPLAKAAYNSVLIDSTKKDDFERVKTLLAKGSSPNVTNANGVTPLMFAAYKGSALAKLFISFKANVNYATTANIDFTFGKLLSNKNSGTTALMLAAYAGKLEIVIALLQSGALVNAQDSDGQTALVYAILGDQQWPHHPLDQNRKKTIWALLEFGANPSIADKNGLDAIYYYSCVAGLVPGFGGQYDTDTDALKRDVLYLRMK